jgi:hypothetical protein
MVGVEMAEEDVVEGEPRTVPHHLPLSTFAAIEHQQLALALNDQRADVSADRRARGGGAQKGYAHEIWVTSYRLPVASYQLPVTSNWIPAGM